MDALMEHNHLTMLFATAEQKSLTMNSLG